MIETKPWPVPPNTVTTYPWTTKINPIWWFGNDEGLDPAYMPEWPMARRRLYWFFRNFMWNFFKYVVGVEDRQLMVTGPAPVFWPVWRDVDPEHFGFKWSIIRTGWLVLPFVSYSGRSRLWYIGWLPSGGRLGLKIN